MRLVDRLLGRAHLSEEELAAAIVGGWRPAHLDRCSHCAHHAREVARWLDELKFAATETADEVFPAERLAAQQTQILRRLAQLDEPARVIAFPTNTAAPIREDRARRVAPAWVGVAAAAGLVVGVIGGRAAARLDQLTEPAGASQVSGQVFLPMTSPEMASEQAPASLPGSLLEMDLDDLTPEELRGIHDLTPRIVPSSYTVAQR